jgi:GMP synthase (glutamine-hydrolysing)
MTGRTLPPIRREHGDFDRWFQEQWESEASYRVHSVFNGEPVPSRADSDGWIITGAPESVNDALPWLLDLKTVVARAVDDDHPILGVCFGHQLLAASCGGHVRINPKGWELGTTEIELTSAGTVSPLFAGLDTPVWVYHSHQETVTELPPAAHVLATNDMGIQAFQMGHRVFGVQFHPEFTSDIARMYVELRTGRNDVGSGWPRKSASGSRKVLANFNKLITV